jgi:hypothetical protein
MTLEQALSSPGSLLGAWEARPPNETGRGFSLYRIIESRLERLANQRVPETARGSLSEDLVRRGIRVAAYSDDVVWCSDDQGFTLWDSDSRLTAQGEGDQLRLKDGRVILISEVQSVTSFASQDMVHRGVQLDLRDGTGLVVLDDRDEYPTIDPGYGRDMLTVDAAWAFSIARSLATWMHVPHVSKI